MAIRDRRGGAAGSWSVLENAATSGSVATHNGNGLYFRDHVRARNFDIATRRCEQRHGDGNRNTSLLQCVEIDGGRQIRVDVVTEDGWEAGHGPLRAAALDSAPHRRKGPLLRIGEAGHVKVHG